MEIMSDDEGKSTSMYNMNTKAMGMKVIDLRPGNFEKGMRLHYDTLFIIFLSLFWVVNTEIKTRITVQAVELHISRAHTVAALKICVPISRFR